MVGKLFSGFRKKNYSYYKQIISEFNRAISIIVDKNQLEANIISKIKELTNVAHIYILLLNSELNRYESIASSSDNLLFKDIFHPQKSKLIYWLSINEKHLLISESPGILSFFYEKEQKILQELNIELIYPLKIMNNIRGLVFLEAKKSGEKFRTDEIDILAILLDQAALAFENIILFEQQQRNLKKMFRADRLGIIGELAAGAAHEIRNPLTSIRSTIQYLYDYIEPPDKKEMALGLINEVDRINEIIQGLLSFSKPSILKKKEINLDILLQDVIRLVSNTSAKTNISVHLVFNSKEKMLLADESQLKQVFLNLIMNAIQAIKNNGAIEICVDHVSDQTNNRKKIFLISIKDSGCGIPEEHLEKIFDPFFTTKKDGTGLGLSIVYGIITKHDGEIEVKSKLNTGTEILIKLPQLNDYQNKVVSK